MRKFTIPIAIVTGLIAPAALAADIGVKAPLPAPAPAWSWTGWYVGVNLGASFGRAKTDFNAAPVDVVTTRSGITRSFTTPGFAGSDTAFPSGFIGGGQIGYNWQFSPIWVAGVEADFQGAAEKDSNTLTSNFSGSVIFPTVTIPVTGATVLDKATKIEWFGTVRLRAGYVWGNGDVMSYLTGGLAYGRVDLEGTSTVSGTVDGVPFSISHAIGHSNVNIGWVVGYGTEGRLASTNWTWKIEGLWMDLGTLDDTDAIFPTIHSVTGGQTFTHTRFTDGILRGGLNYKFY